MRLQFEDWAEGNLLPVAFVAVQDDSRRNEIAQALRRDGWAVVESKTGYHLVQTMSGLILDGQPWIHPHLVVIDRHSPGCSGHTFSDGLRDLGWSTPVLMSDTPVGVIRGIAAQCRDHRKEVPHTANDNHQTSLREPRPVYA